MRLPKRWAPSAVGLVTLLMLLLSLPVVTSAQEESQGVPGPAPMLPYHAKNKCPFEGCVYREWTALKNVPVYDTWDVWRHQVGTIPKGEKATALGGIVITHRPGLIHLDRDLPEKALKRGDRILTYTSRGEGFSQVWTKGQFYDLFDISFTKWPDGSQGCGGAHCAATYIDLGKKAWWAQLRLRSGATCWVEMTDNFFNGVNLLGSTDVPAPAF
jgi:hypothetical protein